MEMSNDTSMASRIRNDTPYYIKRFKLFLTSLSFKELSNSLELFRYSKLQASKTIEAVTQEVYLKITSFLSLILFHLPIAVGISV